jgi:hypothetical protein
MFTLSPKSFLDGNVAKKQLTRIKKYPTVHPQDHIPVNVIAPDLEKGPWIAGGGPLRWYQNIPVDTSDIDVFCKDEKQAQRIISEVLNYSFNGKSSTTFKTDNATTIKFQYDHPGTDRYRDWNIQIITCRYFNSIQEVIDSFDLTVCKVATAGYEWLLGSNAARDIKEKNLRFANLTKTSPKRLVKYWSYGFTPVEGTIQAIQQNAESNWNYFGEEEYANAF